MFNEVLEIIDKIIHLNIFQSNLVNFIIMIALLYYLAAPAIKKSVQELKDKIEKQVSSSSGKKESAKGKLEDTRKDYEKLPEETSDIARTAKNTVTSLEKKAISDVEKAKKILSDNAEKSVKSEAARIKSVLTKDTADLSIKSALEGIKARLSNDDSLHDKLIEQSIDNLEQVK